ncbi:hypothetical protein AM493_13105 [Flavobacterium akiainvivens]|uniref:DinB-like domain-containing protein n=1 Tax=Flavobacterium akiainvivens TaxID=1202724 RepID=A0A0M8MIE5_9FLAO|nr:DinB family protein [Flavobacterium akiainvivens]KOS06861.1 hypothetical protein AM493_13105 [Flavobacterium akiainvivens]SFQ69253.1 hypothetical protein SAMN05444144_11514 [Flavobacterium akiainvivens]
MNRNTFIANRLREVFLNGKWIANTNYKEQLEVTTWQQAVHKVANLNTVAALAYHINYYLGGVLKVLNGGTLDISDKFAFDVPPIESEADWQKLVSQLLANAEAFALAVEQLPVEQFGAIFVDEKYSTYGRNIEGVLEHSYYHLGQIVLIRKLMG